MRALLLTAALMGQPALAGEIWVTNEKDNTISVIDVDTLEVTRTIPVGERPRGEVITNAWIGLLQTLEGSDLDKVVVNLTDVSDDEEGRAVKGFFLSLSLLFGGLAFQAGRFHRAASEGHVIGVEPFALEQTRLTLTGNGSKLYQLLSPDGYSFHPVFEAIFREGLRGAPAGSHEDEENPAEHEENPADHISLVMDGVYKDNGAELAKATVALGLVSRDAGAGTPPILPVPDFIGEDLPGVEGGPLAPAGAFYAAFARDDRSFQSSREAPPELSAFLDAMGQALPRGRNLGHTVVPGLTNDWSTWIKNDLYPGAAPLVRDRLGEVVDRKSFDIEVVQDRPEPGDGEYPMLEPLFITEVAALLQRIREEYAH